MATLLLEDLVKVYNNKMTVDHVTMEVASGAVTGLLGPNGAGKTTTFYMAVGMIQADGGKVLLDGRDLTDDPMYVRARKGLGYLPQESSVFGKLSVRDNIMAILEVGKLSRSGREKKAAGLMDELGITRLADRKAYLLSGGERRRLEIARALATEPLFMLLDEPFAGIDPLAVIDISNIIKHLTERGIGVLISDHSVRETLKVCDTAYILNHGAVIESGSPEKIACSEVAKRFYLGEGFTL
ncbi:lipopolysaccharide export system ATP-binding protein [Desulfatibacillum alkenivorans DSM 16219]|jgi:lipopolysaccharide export system ATP-binding protein|uniref:Lipopolysaccharide export system ATP-binding protein n=1 Tax=Desulfatibacillum alkenivorans DSM 16219 TaxID=1121393 RepID=A0A1M6LQE2_9BACT|nr:LPS export ABC transporter ATP-binding protein [Desulfatibacillum alkenivorans]SHJ73419.1 lipopolysaccharide export system ATP-binding protein [Desulfatibacillum alkenivorans DSM 16219]